MGRAVSTPEGQQLRQPILSLLPRGSGGGVTPPAAVTGAHCTQSPTCWSQRPLAVPSRATALHSGKGQELPPCLSEHPRPHSWQVGRGRRQPQSQRSLSPAQLCTPRTRVLRSGSRATVDARGCRHSQATPQLRPWALGLPSCELTYWPDAGPERGVLGPGKAP